MEEEEIEKVLNSLAYALKSTKDITLRRVIAQEFLASLNRKNVIPSKAYELWEKYLIFKISEVV